MYAAGNALAISIWLLIGLTLGHTFPLYHAEADWFSRFFRLLMGLVMLALGTNLLLKGPRKGQAPSQSASQHPDLRAYSIGMGLMAPNFSSLVLFFPALAALTRGAPARSEEFLFIGLLILIMMSPCLIPLLLVGIAGRGGRALSSIASMTGLNRSNGRWDCWCASPQPNTSSSAESWLLEQPGVAIRMRHKGDVASNVQGQPWPQPPEPGCTSARRSKLIPRSQPFCTCWGANS